MEHITKHRQRIGLYASTAASRSAEGKRGHVRQERQSNRIRNHMHPFAMARILLTIIIIAFYNDKESFDRCSSSTYLIKPVTKNVYDSNQSDICGEAKHVDATTYSNQRHYRFYRNSFAYNDSGVPAIIPFSYNKDYNNAVTKQHQRERFDSLAVQHATHIRPTDAFFVQDIHTLSPASYTLYNTSVSTPDTSPSYLHTEGPLQINNIRTFSANGNTTIPFFIIDNQSRIGNVASNGTCCYLIGNKGTHCYNGNPGRGDEDEATMQPDLCTLTTEGAQESVGCIRCMTVNDNDEMEYQCVGTGFRVGEKYLMTAYHVLRENIENLFGEISLALENSIEPEISVEDMAAKLDAQSVIGDDEPSTEHISEIVHYFLKKNGIRIHLLMSNLEELADMSSVQTNITEWWDKKCVVDFMNHGRFIVDWNIVFGNEDCDIIIVKLNETLPGQDIPRQLLLDQKFRQTDDLLIMRYIIRNRPNIDVDQACFVYTNEAALQSDADRAIDWWKTKCPNKPDHFFNEAYTACRVVHNEDIGRVILRSSKSFVDGSSGSPIVYLFNNDGQPVISMIYQGGYPRFYYEYENDWARRLNVPCDYFFEYGTTMKKVSELLSGHGATDLRKRLFRQPYFSTLSDARPNVQDAKQQDRPDIMIKKINDWRQETICTRSISAAKTKLSTQHCVCVIGKPGAGKSVTIQQCALWLETDFNFTVYSIKSPKEFERYFNEKKKQVFVFDDALGSFSLSDVNIEKWVKHNETFRTGLGKDTKLLLSTSSHLINHQRMSCKNFIFCDKFNRINISDDRYKLTVDEMKDMLTHHLKVHDVTDPDDYIEKIWPTPDSNTGVEFSDRFPLLCKVFSSTESLRQDPYQFFNNPFPAFKKIIENIKYENKAQFCGLVLCALFDGRLTNDILRTYLDQPKHEHHDTVLRDKVISRCGLKTPDDLRYIEETLNSLIGIYVSYTDDKYQISQEIFRDIVVYLFDDPLLVFRYGTSEFIRDRVRIKKQPENDPSKLTLVYADKSSIHLLAGRLLRDLRHDAKSGAKFFVHNPNIDEDVLMSCLVDKLLNRERKIPEWMKWIIWLIDGSRSEIFDRGQIDKKVIDELFKQCMLAFCYERDTLKYKPETWYKLIEVCLRVGADCNMHVLADSVYPLNISVKADFFKVTKLLLQFGADKRRVDWQGGDSILHWVCMYTKNKKFDLIKLLLEQGDDNSVVQIITSDKQEILKELQTHSGNSIRLEEVSSTNTIKVLAKDNNDIRKCLESYTGKHKLQLVRQIHDHILTHSDLSGRNILHYSVDNIQITEYLLRQPQIQEDIYKEDKDGKTPYWYVSNNQYPDSGKGLTVNDQDRNDIIKLYENHRSSQYNLSSV